MSKSATAGNSQQADRSGKQANAQAPVQDKIKAE